MSFPHSINPTPVGDIIRAVRDFYKRPITEQYIFEGPLIDMINESLERYRKWAETATPKDDVRKMMLDRANDPELAEKIFLKICHILSISHSGKNVVFVTTFLHIDKFVFEYVNRDNLLQSVVSDSSIKHGGRIIRMVQGANV